jgi:rhamnosyltransferase
MRYAPCEFVVLHALCVMNMPVTVAIPTLNAGQDLPRLLQALKEQTVPYELLVIDSSSSDDTVPVAASFGAKTITVRREDFDHGGTRNLAVQEAKGDFIVFLTQDAVPANEHALEHLLRPFSDPRVAAAYGRQLPNSGASTFAEHLRLFKYPAEARVKGLQDKAAYGIETPFLSDSFSAYRKEALQEVGLFKHGIIFAEDVHAGARLILAGHSIAYVPAAEVYHSHNHTMVEECKRYFDTAVFYQSEAWIGEAFGRNNREAWRYTWSEFLYVGKHGKPLLLLEFFPRTALRVIGFILGRCYRMLPRGLCRRLSAHPGWWSDAQSAERRAKDAERKAQSAERETQSAKR